MHDACFNYYRCSELHGLSFGASILIPRASDSGWSGLWIVYRAYYTCNEHCINIYTVPNRGMLRALHIWWKYYAIWLRFYDCIAAVQNRDPADKNVDKTITGDNSVPGAQGWGSRTGTLVDIDLIRSEKKEKDFFLFGLIWYLCTIRAHIGNRNNCSKHMHFK